MVKQLHAVRQQILKRNRENGALEMQSTYRAYIDRISYQQQMTEIKTATNTIWTAYKCMQYKHCLEHWLIERAAIRARELAQKAQEEEERKQREAEAAKLLKEAEEAKSKFTITVTSPRPSADDEKQKEMDLQKQIKAKRQKQTMASFALKRKKTQNLLEVADAERMRRNQTIEQSMDRRTTADLTLVAEMSQRAKDALQEENEDSDSSTSIGTDSDNDDGKDDDDSDCDQFDITELLENFSQIARLGARFSRHAGKRVTKKPQLRTVKVSFDEQGTPLTLSWGAGSRAIKMKDIWYIA